MKSPRQGLTAHLTKNVRVLGSIALLATVVAANAQTGNTAAPESKGGSAGMSGMPMGGMMKGDMAKSEMRQSMMPSMQAMQSMRTTGDADQDFASMMRIHHQGAVDMAQAELNSGHDPKLREMAKKIIASQQQEIKEFDQWLAAHKASDKAPAKK